MTNLPIFQMPDRNLMLLQNSWKAAITPTLQLEINQGLLLTDIKLKTGDNVINHHLGRKPNGYFIADQDASASFYRNKPLDNLTLTLNASAPVTIRLWVF